MTQIRLVRPSALLLAVLAGSFVVLTALSLANAQGLDPAGGPGLPDPRVLGSSWWQLGMFVLALMTSLKRATDRTWPTFTDRPRLLQSSLFWYVLAIVTGVVAAFLLSSMSYGAALVFQGLVYPWTVLAYGALAGITGAGLWDIIRAALGIFAEILAARGGGAAPVTTVSAGGSGSDPALQPGGDGSPQTNGNEALGPQLVGAAPLFGLPPAVTAIAGSLLGSPILEGVVKGLLAAAGLPTGVTEVLAVGARLAPIAPDLLDGNPQLSTENLAKINRVILDLKAEHLGGTQ